jgi:hypothetical protein
MRLRSIELEVPDRDSAVRFFLDTWGLLDAGEQGGTSYLRGTEALPYVVSVSQANAPTVAAVTFSGTRPEILGIRKRAAAAGARLGPLRDFDDPGGGSGFLVGSSPRRSARKDCVPIATGHCR